MVGLKARRAGEGRAMGKYMRKCSRGIGEVAVMEVTQVVGVRTRARALALAAASSGEAAHDAGQKRRKVEGGEFHVSYLQLRSRSLILTPGKNKRGVAAAAASDTPATSRSSAAPGNSGADGQCGAGGGGEWDRVSRCSSNTSSEVLAAAPTERASSRSGRPAREVREREARAWFGVSSLRSICCLHGRYCPFWII